MFETAEAVSVSARSMDGAGFSAATERVDRVVVAVRRVRALLGEEAAPAEAIWLVSGLLFVAISVKKDVHGKISIAEFRAKSSSKISINFMLLVSFQTGRSAAVKLS
ncbi:MAG TPA: hypothetical protein VKV17_08590 [Bryobacteraceae bacterium]|nr:hypothetical protein [Bryobacteraceae bacterium]